MYYSISLFKSVINFMKFKYLFKNVQKVFETKLEAF